ncbi:hypothetical protein DFH07DRAFT_801336 [Mycena maculata]|uniref:F-box domain-containing protein n=1 Tax=Mycena maculata TaxID=230809 RepID=A0AAD7JZ94_9AGAR|nr:hypothetical protein DFH07DRAFT_801336 [Mycena maculata]
MAVGAAVARLPFEIWLHIKELVDPAESSSFYSVNRAWFEIVMNSRYRVLDLTHLDEGVLSRLPLVKDPGISKRVRHLSISGLALQNSLLSSITGQRVKFPMDRHALSILNRRIRALDVTTVLNPKVRLISDVLSMLNVSEYSVKWDFREGIQSGEVIHAVLQAAVLDVTWPTFGTTLRKLFVSTRPERFHPVLSSDVRLAQLEEFHLEILHTSNSAQCHGIQDAFPEYVSSFFARVNPRLETLSIQSSSNLDLACLFHQLPSFKNLHRLCLHIFLDSGVLSDASGLDSFFAESALKLRQLTLFLYHDAMSSVARVLPSLAMVRARIPCLETLEVNFGMPHQGLTPPLLHELHVLFNGARNTLHTVVLEGIALSHADLATATAVLADRDALGRLTLSVLTLTTRHIDTLAKNAPRIRALGLIFTHLSLFPDGPPEPESECRESFMAEMRVRTYPDWELQDISIWHHARSVDSSRWDLVSLFPACVPTVTNFFGHPLPKRAQNRPVPRMLDALVVSV